MAFTPQEKVKIRHHLGFLNVTNAATFSLGIPQAVETQFIIERAMDLVLVEAEVEARRHVSILDRIEGQMVEDHDLLAVEKVGEITIRKDEQNQLRKEYEYWRNALANVMGIYPNPWDKRFGINPVNVPVRH